MKLARSLALATAALLAAAATDATALASRGNALVASAPDSGGNALVVLAPDADAAAAPSGTGGGGNTLADTSGPSADATNTAADAATVATTNTDADSGSAEPTSTPICALIKCSGEGAGVCGSDGRTYANACQLTAATCGSPGLKLVHEGPCGSGTGGKDPAQNGDSGSSNNSSSGNDTTNGGGGDTGSPDACARACPRIYLPVCDADGRVYSNACEFAAEQCRRPALRLGACPSARGCALPMCAPIERPVCASNGRSYMNRCLFSYFACKDPSLRVVHAGECGAGGPQSPKTEPPSTEPPFSEQPVTCAALSCPQFSECREVPHSRRGYCADVCAPQRCAPNERCVLRDVQCFAAPCPPVAACVKRT